MAMSDKTKNMLIGGGVGAIAGAVVTVAALKIMKKL